MSGQIAGAPLGGPSPVARGQHHLSGRTRAAGAVACCVLAAGALAWVVWPRHAAGPEARSVGGQNWSLGRTLPEHPILMTPREETRATAAVPAPARVEPPPAAVPAPAETRAMGFWEDANAMQQAARQATATPPAAAPDQSDVDVGAPRPASEYAQRMQATRFADATPVPPRFHVQYTIKKGTIFPCTPAAPVSSSLPGPVQCTVDQDVWSMDGTTILLPRGTQVNGTIERGLTTGEERLFLVWTDALTPRPDLLAIPLDSPGADEMGQTGAPGDVNDHLWKRLRAALLLSAVDIAGNVATAAAQSGTRNTNLNIGGNVGGTATSLGQMAFAHDLNIPPTLYRGPGQPLTVYVNHYIDLVHFYQNQAVR